MMGMRGNGNVASHSLTSLLCGQRRYTSDTDGRGLGLNSHDVAWIVLVRVVGSDVGHRRLDGEIPVGGEDAHCDRAECSEGADDATSHHEVVGSFL